MRAAMTAASPTAPVPKMAMLAPSNGQRVHHRPGPGLHPAAQRSQELQRQVSGNLDGLRSVASAWVANEDWPKKWPRTPLRSIALLPSDAQIRSSHHRDARNPPDVTAAGTATAAGLVGQDDVVAALDALDRPPTSSTTPAPSCPSTSGPLSVPPSQKPISVWQMPEATMRTRISSSRGPSIWRDSGKGLFPVLRKYFPASRRLLHRIRSRLPPPPNNRRTGRYRNWQSDSDVPKIDLQDPLIDGDVVTEATFLHLLLGNIHRINRSRRHLPGNSDP